MVVVEASADGHTGLGYTYGPAAAGALVGELLEDVVCGSDALDVPGTWHAMVARLRNAGRPGIGSLALSAIDTALWDLKARLLELPLVSLLGAVRERVPLYGSGGFTTYSLERLQRQLAGWVEEGIPRVKMKIGTHLEDDLGRVRAAREAIGEDADLFVDANGAYSRKQALAQADAFALLGVSWFEEPVSSDDLEGLSLIRRRAPLEIAAGEYGYDAIYFRRLLEAGAVDVLQADASRCGGITGFLQAGALAAAFELELSGHCAPALHAHACAAAQSLRHLEWFHDHVRIERLLFDGTLEPQDGALVPDRTRPGNGLELKRADAERYAA